MEKKIMALDAEVLSLSLGDIIPDVNQPRKTMATNSLVNLGQSLARTSQISPVVVRPTINGKYMIITGERRWRAAKEAGIPQIKCIVRSDIDDRKAIEMQLAENYQREDVSPLEQAEAFKAYIEKYGVSQSELSRRTGIPQRTISARLALLSLTASMRARLEAGEIGPYEAIKINKLPLEYQGLVADAVSSGKIGGRMLEKICKIVRRESERKIDDIIDEISEVKHKLTEQDTSKTLGVNPLLCTREDYAKQVNKTNEHSAEKYKKDDILSDFVILLNIVKDFGSAYRETCSQLNKDGSCTGWIWETKDDIPNGAGEPVKSGNIWHLKPSVMYCAFCSNHIGARLEEALDKLDVNPILRLRHYFKCQCGAKGKVAVFVKCTQCHTEGWYDPWRPSNPN